MIPRFCAQCGSDIGAADEFCRHCGHARRTDGEIFFPVSPLKFVLMNLATFTLYSYYWAYRCWRYAASISPRQISPSWRTALLPLFAFPLLNRIEAGKLRALSRDARRDGKAEPESGARIPINLALAIAFLLLSAANSLPDPYSIVGVFAFAPFLPALHDINRLNGRQGDYYRRNSRFGVLKGAFVLVMLPIVALMSAETVGLLAPDGVAGGSSLVGWEQRVLSQYSGLAFQPDGSPCLPGIPAGLDSLFKLPGQTTGRSAHVPDPDAGHLRLAQGNQAGPPRGFQRAPSAAPAQAPAAQTAPAASAACPNP